MKLVFIYGPPAVGKLTVAKELQELTGYRLFHNHLSLDLAREIFPEWGEPLFKLADEFRLSAFAASARNDTNLIFTNVYSPSAEDDNFVRTTVETIEDNNGTVSFVRLTASLETLQHRVLDESRSSFKKLTTVDKLDQALARHDSFAKISNFDGLTIDTSNLPAGEAARQIQKHFAL